jgi:hypothetical protein
MEEMYSNAPNVEKKQGTPLLCIRPETGYSEVLPLGQCFSTFLHGDTPKIIFSHLEEPLPKKKFTGQIKLIAATIIQLLLIYCQENVSVQSLYKCTCI